MVAGGVARASAPNRQGRSAHFSAAHTGLKTTGVLSPVRRSFTAILLFGFLLLRNSADAIATA
jgi:hypothetical protein